MLKGISSRWAATIVTMLGGYVLLPFLVRYLARDGYGTWMLVGSLTSMMGLLMLGAPLASLRYLSQAIASDDRAETERIVSTCLGLYLLMALAAAIAGAGLFLMFARFPISNALRTSSYVAYSIAVVGTALGFLGRLPMSILSAQGDFVVQSGILVVTEMARVVGTIVLLRSGGSLTTVALVQLFSVAAQLALFHLVIRRRYPTIRARVASIDRDLMSAILTFSVPVLLIGIGGYLSFQTDPLVIGATIGVPQIPFYMVGSRLVAMLSTFSQAMAAVVTPDATKLHTRGAHVELAELLMKWGEFSCLMTGVAVAGLVIVGPSFASWWVGPTFEQPTAVVLRVLAGAQLLLVPAQSVAFPVLLAVGRLRAAGFAFLAAGAANILLSLLLGPSLGLAGIALGTAIPTAFYAAYLHVLACGAVDLPVRTYAIRVALRPALLLVPFTVLLTWLSRAVA